MSNSPGLLSYLHRSLDGTRMFNYGQWESKEAFEAILKQPGFNPEQTVLEGLARNEFHLYNVVHTASIIGSRRVFSPVVLPKLFSTLVLNTASLSVIFTLGEIACYF